MQIAVLLVACVCGHINSESRGFMWLTFLHKQKEWNMLRCVFNNLRHALVLPGIVLVTLVSNEPMLPKKKQSHKLVLYYFWWKLMRMSDISYWNTNQLGLNWQWVSAQRKESTLNVTLSQKVFSCNELKA